MISGAYSSVGSSPTMGVREVAWRKMRKSSFSGAGLEKSKSFWEIRLSMIVREYSHSAWFCSAISRPASVREKYRRLPPLETPPQ